MNKKIRQNYMDLAQSIGFSLDEESGVLYGKSGGYDVLLCAQNASYPYLLTACVSAQRSMGPLTKEECKQFKKQNKSVMSMTQKSSVISVMIKNSPKPLHLRENVAQALDAFVGFLSSEGFSGCCSVCGTQESIPCCVSGSCTHLCSNCFSKMQMDSSMDNAQKKGRGENVAAGIVGALLGSLLGVVSIVVLGQLGYVAALSGIIIAICTLKGYEMLGGSLSKKGIIISVILMVVMTYMGDRLDWAFLVAHEMDIDLFSAFRSISGLIAFGAIERSIYFGSLAMQYLFVALGAIPTILNVLRSSRLQGHMYRLDNKNTTSYQNQVEL